MTLPGDSHLRDLEGTAGRADLDPTVGWGRNLDSTVEAEVPDSWEDPLEPGPSADLAMQWLPPAGPPWLSAAQDLGRAQDLDRSQDRADDDRADDDRANDEIDSADDELPAEELAQDQPVDEEVALAGEEVALAVAPMVTRALAGGVDYGVPLLVTVLAMWVSAGLGGLVALVAVAFVSYNTVEQGLTGYTPGKRLTRIKLVGRSTGEPIGTGRVAIRLLVHMADLVAVGGMVPMATDPLTRTLGDRVVGAVVVVDQEGQ